MNLSLKEARGCWMYAQEWRQISLAVYALIFEQMYGKQIVSLRLGANIIVNEKLGDSVECPEDTDHRTHRRERNFQ